MRRLSGTNSSKIVASIGIFPPSPKPQNAVNVQIAAQFDGAPMTSPNALVIRVYMSALETKGLYKPSG